MTHNQANGDDPPGPQEDNRYPPLQDANASLKIRLAGIALDRQEKLKAEVCKVIEGIEHRPCAHIPKPNNCILKSLTQWSY